MVSVLVLQAELLPPSLRATIQQSPHGLRSPALVMASLCQVVCGAVWTSSYCVAVLRSRFVGLCPYVCDGQAPVTGHYVNSCAHLQAGSFALPVFV
jgi:hypothetical protein